MKWWPTALFAVVMFLLFSNYNPKEQQKYVMLNDGCLVHALAFQQAIQAKETLDEYLWTRVLCIQFYGMVAGHAVTVFVYKNITWVYDPNRGSFPAANFPLYDPLMIAEISFPKLSIKKAYYIEPTLLLHSYKQALKFGNAQFNN
jgi:hypothetical protein